MSNRKKRRGFVECGYVWDHPAASAPGMAIRRKCALDHNHRRKHEDIDGYEAPFKGPRGEVESQCGYVWQERGLLRQGVVDWTLRKCVLDYGHPDSVLHRDQFGVSLPAPKPHVAPPGAAVDLINHPPHYTRHPSGVECITATEHMNFCLGNAVKYIWRAGAKSGATALDDLKKASWYVDREIERLQKLSEKKS